MFTQEPVLTDDAADTELRLDKLLGVSCSAYSYERELPDLIFVSIELAQLSDAWLREDALSQESMQRRGRCDSN